MAIRELAVHPAIIKVYSCPAGRPVHRPIALCIALDTWLALQGQSSWRSEIFQASLSVKSTSTLVLHIE